MTELTKQIIALLTQSNLPHSEQLAAWLAARPVGAPPGGDEGLEKWRASRRPLTRDRKEKK